MNKKIDKSLIISTILCIVPLLFSIAIYNKIPEKIPSHFDFNGEITSYQSKFFICIMLPIIFCILNLILNIILKNDPKKKNHSESLLIIARFSIPSASLIFILSSILISMGFNISIPMVSSIFISILFILIGNYLPKCKTNYTMGIRLPWTLNNEDNWKKTHRLAGFLWIISGLIILITTFINKNLLSYTLIILIILSAVVPSIYSFILYKKCKRT